MPGHENKDHRRQQHEAGKEEKILLVVHFHRAIRVAMKRFTIAVKRLPIEIVKSHSAMTALFILLGAACKKIPGP